jgi:hypothetical protein
MRQPDNLPAFCRIHRNGRPLIGMCVKPASRPANSGMYTDWRRAATI